MQYVGDLITLARQRTGNVDYSATSGIPDSLMVRTVNHAQSHLQAAILAVFPNEFHTKLEISLTSGTQEYTITDNVFMNNKIVLVEYSQSGNATDYYPLRQGHVFDVRTSQGQPEFYVRRNGKIVLSHVPSTTSGKIRVTYDRAVDALDIRRGTVNGTPSGTTLVVTNPDEASLPLNFTTAEYFCISNRFGDVLLYNGKISSYDSGTNTITGAANISTYLVSGYTLANLASQYITFGKYSTTHSKLPEPCERYLEVYLQKRALTLDESETSLEEDAELKMIESDILNSYTEESRDVDYIPILDRESYF